MTIRRELFAGEVLYAQGDASDCAWLIERGAVELVSVHGRRETRRGGLGPGELIGEVGLLDGSPRTDTATARGATVLLAVEPDQFRERLEEGDAVVRALVDSLLRYKQCAIATLPAGAPLQAEDVACDEPAARSGMEKIRLEGELSGAVDQGLPEVRAQPICH